MLSLPEVPRAVGDLSFCILAIFGLALVIVLCIRLYIDYCFRVHFQRTQPSTTLYKTYRAFGRCGGPMLVVRRRVCHVCKQQGNGCEVYIACYENKPLVTQFDFDNELRICDRCHQKHRHDDFLNGTFTFQPTSTLTEKFIT